MWNFVDASGGIETRISTLPSAQLSASHMVRGTCALHFFRASLSTHLRSRRLHKGLRDPGTDRRI